jgi:hypothetical protein
MALFGADGEIYFRAVEGASTVVHAIKLDGSNRRRLSERGVGLKGVSWDGNWIVTRIHDQGEGTTTAISLRDGRSLSLFEFQSTHFSWARDKILISVPIRGGSYGLAGKTYVIPLAAGQVFPPIPPGGFRSVAEIAQLPGATVIDGIDIVAAPTGDVYAYSRQSVQRNLYRIPLP